MFELIIASLIITAAICLAYYLGVKAGRKAEFTRIMLQINPLKVAMYISKQDDGVKDAMSRMASRMIKWIGEEDG